ncbi:hypothetical protein FKM82_013267 [Ascaphus truei]
MIVPNADCAYLQECLFLDTVETICALTSCVSTCITNPPKFRDLKVSHVTRTPREREWTIAKIAQDLRKNGYSKPKQ